jgi:hypothetical protein
MMACRSAPSSMMFKARFKVAESPDVSCAELWPLMARLRHADRTAQCPSSRDERTQDGHGISVAIDPNATLSGSAGHGTQCSLEHVLD